MSETSILATPQEIVFGERYEDDSGYIWRIALVRTRDGERRVEVGEGDFLAYVDPMKVTVRELASALNQIADLLEEPQ